MKCHTVRQKVEPVLAPDQFSVARSLRPEDLDRCVTWHGIYPLLPAPNGVPWSEYVRSQRNKTRSVSSSTEALESDHARYITHRIAQHARSMGTGTRSLPTNSPVPHFQLIERGPMSEGRLSELGSQEGMYVPPYINPWEKAERPGGNDYHSNILEMDRVSTYIGLDDYDTLFAARHGRGALDPAPRTSEQMIMTTSVGITPSISDTGLMVNPLNEVELTSNIEHSGQREGTSHVEDPLKHRVVMPSSEIIGEGAAIFTDMTETILNALDQQMAMSADAQNVEGLPIGKGMTMRQIGNDQIDKIQDGTQQTFDPKEKYPDLFLPVVENYRISDQFCGYLDSLSADNNPMVLVELKCLSY